MPLDTETLQALTGIMPLIESLRISPTEREADSMDFPSGLLGGQAPRLRILALRGFSTFFTQTAILRNVVSLTISRGVDADDYTRPT